MYINVRNADFLDIYILTKSTKRNFFMMLHHDVLHDVFLHWPSAFTFYTIFAQKKKKNKKNVHTRRRIKNAAVFVSDEIKNIARSLILRKVKFRKLLV